MAKKGSSGDGFEAGRRYAGRYGVETGPVPLERQKPARPRLGESLRGDDLRPELDSHRRREKD